MNVSNLRERIPYKFSATEKDDLLDSDNHVLDEQEQEAVIETLREHNARSDTILRFGIHCFLGLSAVMQLYFLLVPFPRSPLEHLWPPRSSAGTSRTIPLSNILTVLNLFIHVELLLQLHRHRTALQSLHPFLPIPLTVRYALSAIAPVLSVLVGCSWQTSLWWWITAATIFAFENALSLVQSGREDMAHLESLRYRAPGA